ncbi:MAG: hypothetical protein Q9163_000254 [Psora crenata]
MIGKRKRTQGSEQPESLSSSSQIIVLPLTRTNLTTLNAEATSDSVSFETFPTPFENIMNPQTPTNKTTSASKSSANPALIEQILTAYRIFIDREMPLPDPLRKLVDDVLVPRGGDLTPNSKFLKAAKDMNKIIKEDLELHLLADKIAYRAKLFPDDSEGQEMIWVGRSDQWGDRVPKPAHIKNNSALQAAFEQLDSPSKPKPDMSFGYRDDVFSEALLAKLKGLRQDLHVYPDKPWYPYMVMEWKSYMQSPLKSEQQARRDCSAAIDTMYRFLRSGRPTNDSWEPSPAETCVFSICVHYQGFDYRVHWRRVDEKGEVSYEADIVAQARYRDPQEIFRTRGAIMKTLDWARGARLTMIRNKLAALISAGATQLSKYIATDDVTPYVAHYGLIMLTLLYSTPQSALLQPTEPSVHAPQTPPQSLTHASVSQPRKRRRRSRQGNMVEEEDCTADRDNELDELR